MSTRKKGRVHIRCCRGLEHIRRVTVQELWGLVLWGDSGQLAESSEGREDGEGLTH